MADTDMIIWKDTDAGFATDVIRRSRTDLNRCYHCRCCVSGCPFTAAMDYPPNSVIRLVQLGLKKEALTSATIWTCVGCHTCSTLCPMSIDMAAVMDALRETAIAEGYAAQPDILGFHREVLNSIEKYGRTHKLEIMLRYKVRRQDWFGDMNVGLRMLAKRKLDLLPSKVSDMRDIKRLFERSAAGGHDD